MAESARQIRPGDPVLGRRCAKCAKELHPDDWVLGHGTKVIHAAHVVEARQGPGRYADYPY